MPYILVSFIPRFYIYNDFPYIGVVAFFWTRVLFAAHMFPGANGTNSAKQRFEDTINSIQWPTHITRLPKNVSFLLYYFNTWLYYYVYSLVKISP